MHSFLHSSRYQLFVLLFLWLSVQVYAYLHFGIGKGCDTDFYISIGEGLSKGMWPQGRAVYYASYGLVFALFYSWKISFEHIVWLQLLCAGLSLYCLYRLAQHICKSLSAAFVTCVLYIVWIKIHQWNFFLYTESLYTSFSIILIWLLLVKLSSPWSVLGFFLCMTWTCMLRPTSVCVVGGIAVYGLYRLHSIKPHLFLFGVLLVALVSLLGLNKMLQDYELIESYQKAEIIYPNIKLWVEVPHELVALKTSYPIWDLVAFIIYNPIYFTKLFIVKLALFYANIKPYFSWMHNVAIVLFLWPLYLLMGKMLYDFWGKREVMVLATIVVFQGLIVGLTTENWDGRFLVPVLPFVFVLAGGALGKKQDARL